MSTDIKKKTLEDTVRAAKAAVGLAEKKEDTPKQSGFVEYTGGDAQLDRDVQGNVLPTLQGGGLWEVRRVALDLVHLHTAPVS